MPQLETTLSPLQSRIRPFGLDLFCLGKKFLVYNLVSRNLIIKYRRSALGLLWTLVAPTGLACIYYFVFQKVLKIQVPHYLGFIMSGMFLWTYFNRCLIEGTDSIQQNWQLLTKIPIPLQVFPLVVVITHLVTLTFAIPVLLVGVHVSGASPGPVMLLLPVYLFALFLISYGFALILGLGYVYFRDLRHVIELLMQVWFYATPVLYDGSMIPEKYRWILFLNPVGLLFQHIHVIMIQGQVPPANEMGCVFLWTFGILVLGALVFRRGAPNAVEFL